MDPWPATKVFFVPKWPVVALSRHKTARLNACLVYIIRYIGRFRLNQSIML